MARSQEVRQGAVRLGRAGRAGLPRRAPASTPIPASAFGVRLGYDLFRWLDVQAHVIGRQLRRVDAAADGSASRSRRYLYAGEVRLKLQIHRFQLFAEGGAGAGAGVDQRARAGRRHPRHRTSRSRSSAAAGSTTTRSTATSPSGSAPTTCGCRRSRAATRCRSTSTCATRARLSTVRSRNIAGHGRRAAVARDRATVLCQLLWRSGSVRGGCSTARPAGAHLSAVRAAAAALPVRFCCQPQAP